MCTELQRDEPSLSRMCHDCGGTIAEARLDLFPHTEWCVNCADKHTPRRVCRVIYPHKTGGELFVAEGDENIRRLDNEYKRKR